MKFPLLEELEVSRCRRIEHICMPELVANLCPQIKHFRHTRSRDRYCVYNINRPGNDSQALAIASMRQLRSLQLFRDDMTNEGLMTILDKCPYLESIDIRSCRNLTMDGTLRARCAMIKTKTLYPCKPADEDEDFQPGSPISYCSTCAGNTDMDIGSESDFDDISGIDYDDDWYDSYCCDYLSDTEEADLAVHNIMLEKSMRRYINRM